jgi:hypothetical protein
MRKGGRDWSILDRLLEGCLIVDRDWRYVYLNNKACAQIRKSRDELVGRTTTDAHPGIEKTELFHNLKRCMENRSRDKFTSKSAFPNGKVGFFKFVIEPVPEGLMIISMDLTEQYLAKKKVEDKYALLKAIANTVSIMQHPEDPVVMRVLSRFEIELYEKYFVDGLDRNIGTFGDVVAKIYNDIGGEFACNVDGHSLSLRGSACPWDNQTVCNPVYCKIMRGMICRFGEKFLGDVTIKQVSSIGKGDDECAFLLSC